jgi:hypothetical protein
MCGVCVIGVLPDICVTTTFVLVGIVIDGVVTGGWGVPLLGVPVGDRMIGMLDAFVLPRVLYL